MTIRHPIRTNICFSFIPLAVTQLILLPLLSFFYALSFLSFLFLSALTCTLLTFSCLILLILSFLERKTQEKIRALQEELSKERETFAQKLDQMKAEYEKSRLALEGHEVKLREQVDSLEKVLNCIFD